MFLVLNLLRIENIKCAVGAKEIFVNIAGFARPPYGGKKEIFV